MSRFNAKMNELAESIKGKNPDVSGKLSITGMIDAVNGITISDGSSVALSGVTATANDVLASVKFMDKTGTLKSGVIQTVTLEKSGNTVSVKKGYVAADSSITIESGSGDGGTGTGGVELYRCISYDNGKAIPAYDNLSVTGNTAEVNGTYTKNDAALTPKYAKWSKGNIEFAYNALENCWVLYDKTTNPAGTKSASLFYADAPYLTNSTGMPGDPYRWQDIESDTPNVTKVLTDSMCNKNYIWSSSNYHIMYIQLYLTAGVEYTIGLHYPAYHYYGMDYNLYRADDLYDGRLSYSSTSLSIGDITFEMGRKYTVSESGVYILCAYCTGGDVTAPDFMLGVDKSVAIPANPAQSPAEVAAWTAGNGSGSLKVSKVSVAERPATGVKVWSGAKATQADDFTWSYADTVTTGMTVIGLEPVVGKTYSDDTTIEVAQTYSIKPPTVDSTELMVCLVHFDGDSRTFVDATETCIVSVGNQAGITHDAAKFGEGCWEGNYLNPPEGGVNVSMLPLLDAFTIEWWEWYRGNVEFGGAVMAVMDYDSWEWKFLNGVNLLPGHPLYKKQEWFHHAFVREKGSSVVTEYISGIPVATHSWEGLLGGSDTVWFGAGGVYGQNHNNRGDELAVFSYARYHGAFTPNNAPYPNINSGLNVDPEEREVAVSGLTGIHLANKRSYALLNQESEGTDRVWITADGKWRICYDNNMEGEWIITDREPDMDGNYTVIARLPIEYDENDEPLPSEPIGNPNWKDAVTGAKVNVIRLRDPEPNDQKWGFPTKFYLTGCAVEGINGEYTFMRNVIRIGTPGAISGYWELDGWQGPNGYIIHSLLTFETLTFYTEYIVHKDNPLVHLYQCSIWDMITPGHKWGCMAGVEPAPVISLTKPLI